MEMGKCYKSRLFPPTPETVVKHFPGHNCLQLPLGAYPCAIGGNFYMLEESPKLSGVYFPLPSLRLTGALMP